MSAFKSFNIEQEIRRVNALYVNPLVRCSDCGHRVCRCYEEKPEPRGPATNHDNGADWSMP